MTSSRVARLLPLCLTLACSAAPPPATARHTEPPEPPPQASLPAPRVAPDGVEARFTDPERRAKLAAAFPRIDTMFAEEHTSSGAPALAVGIVVDGELAFAKGYGKRDVERGGAVDEHTVFRIGSITKVVTALAALKLVEDGVIALDAPAERYLPELGKLVYPTSDAPRITVRHLMTYSSGLPYAGTFDDSSTVREPTEAEVLASLDGLPLQQAPGTSVRYSNLEYAVLGLLVARQSKLSFRRYVDQALLEPLGMKATKWRRLDVPADQLATAYAKADGKPRPVDHWLLGAGEGSAGLYSSVADMAKLASFELAAWPARTAAETGPISRARVRESQTVTSFYSALLRRDGRGNRAVFSSGAGYGWWVHRDCQLDNVVVKDGGMEGYRAAVLLLPDRGVGVVALANFPMDLTSLTKRAAGLLLETGGLKPREVAPSAALVERAKIVTELLGTFDPERFRQTFTKEFLDQVSEAEFRSWMKWQADRHGSCRFERFEPSQSPLAAPWLATCDRGKRRFTMPLAGPRTPQFDAVTAESIFAPPPALLERLSSAIAGYPSWDDKQCEAIAKGSFACKDLVAALRGAAPKDATCALGGPIRGDGSMSSALELRCGDRELVLLLDLADGRVTSARVRSADAPTRCD